MTDRVTLPDTYTVQTLTQLQETLDRINWAPSCVDMQWEWEVKEISNTLVEPSHRYTHPTTPAWLFRTCFIRPDTETGEISKGYGRWWLVEKGASPSGVVKTAWMACEQILKHELMEAFLVDGKRIFDPHKSIGELILGSR